MGANETIYIHVIKKKTHPDSGFTSQAFIIWLPRYVSVALEDPPLMWVLMGSDAR